jgi:hypothetical protein
MLDLDSGGRPEALLATPADESYGRVSPNGKWIAYQSVEVGRGAPVPKLYVRPFPRTDATQRAVSEGAAVQPFWSQDGKQIYYLAYDSALRLMMVPVEETATTVTPGGPVTIMSDLTRFPYSLEGTQHATVMDILPKSGGFIAVKAGEADTANGAAGGASRPHVNVVLNWFEELKQRVPVE